MSKRNSPCSHRLFGAAWVLICLLFSFTLMAQEKQPVVVLDFDHASVCGADLDALRQAFTDVGLTPDFGGPHGNGITQMALIGFDDESYLELIAPVKAGVTEGSDWAKFMAGDATACAWATATNALPVEVDRLKKAGITVSAPQPGSRKRPDGMSIQWTTAQVGPGPAGSMLPFMIEDRTPRAWRAQPSASVKGSPLTGVENVVIGVNNLETAIALFRKAYNWSEPIIEVQKDIGRMAYFPGEPVILASPNGGWLADRIGKYGESPVAFLLGTKDYAAVAKKYKLSGGKMWFGQRVGWFETPKLKGVRLGVIGP